jgi:ATP-dependent Clp protease ATP-binding subunit ClpA
MASNSSSGLEKYGFDLTFAARRGQLDPVIGRDKQTKELMEVLCRRRKNNAVLLGEPGVGKTAVAEGLAQRIASGNVPARLINKRIISIDLSLMIAGTRYRGEFEARLRRVIDDAREDHTVVLVIDEMHTLIGAGSAEGAMDAANILKPALARGELQCIGATTNDEYKKYIERDAALQRRFQPITVPEPTVDETVQILKGLRNSYELYHLVTIEDEALLACAQLSSQYITDRFLPDKAIDLMDQSGARANLNASMQTPLSRRVQLQRESLRYLDLLKLESLRTGNIEAIQPLHQLEKAWQTQLLRYLYVRDEGKAKTKEEAKNEIAERDLTLKEYKNKLRKELQEEIKQKTTNEVIDKITTGVLYEAQNYIKILEKEREKANIEAQGLLEQLGYEYNQDLEHYKPIKGEEEEEIDLDTDLDLSLNPEADAKVIEQQLIALRCNFPKSYDELQSIKLDRKKLEEALFNITISRTFLKVMSTRDPENLINDFIERRIVLNLTRQLLETIEPEKTKEDIEKVDLKVNRLIHKLIIQTLDEKVNIAIATAMGKVFLKDDKLVQSFEDELSPIEVRKELTELDDILKEYNKQYAKVPRFKKSLKKVRNKDIEAKEAIQIIQQQPSYMKDVYELYSNYVRTYGSPLRDLPENLVKKKPLPDDIFIAENTVLRVRDGKILEQLDPLQVLKRVKERYNFLLSNRDIEDLIESDDSKFQGKTQKLEFNDDIQDLKSEEEDINKQIRTLNKRLKEYFNPEDLGPFKDPARAEKYEDYLNSTPMLERDFLEYLRTKLSHSIPDNIFERICVELGNAEEINRLQEIQPDDSKEIIEKMNPDNLRELAKPHVTKNNIAQLIADFTGIPVMDVTKEESAKLQNLENILHERVIGQDEAVFAISSAVRRARVGISNPNRPIASFIFCGPTGVGKTELTKTLAAHMFGTEDSVIRLDMSEFMEKHTIAQLIGAPPGYIGYTEGGQLTEKVRRKPYSVVLFDEIEKAHPDILDILLQLLDDGRLTDSQGRTINFKNTIVVLTSNIGSHLVQAHIEANPTNDEKDFKIKDSFFTKKDSKSNKSILSTKNLLSKTTISTEESENSEILFYKDEEKPDEDKSTIEKKVDLDNDEVKFKTKKGLKERMFTPEDLGLDKESSIIEAETEKNKKEEENYLLLRNKVFDELRQYFRPEFLNRLDEVIVFRQLTKKEVRKIADIMINDLCKRIAKQGQILKVSEEAKDKLLDQGFDPVFGARPMRRAITKLIENGISEKLLTEQIEKGDKILVNVDSLGNFTFVLEKKPQSESIVVNEAP